MCDKTIEDNKMINGRHGNGTIIVVGEDGTHYAAPQLIHHYVKEHHYKPPQGFKDAVMAMMITSISEVYGDYAVRQQKEKNGA